MPTYEYECQACGHLYELYQPITAKPKRTCPECKGRVKRLLGKGAGLLFKGSGFYQTDYRSQGYHDAAKKDQPESKSDAAKSDAAKSDTAKSDTAKSDTAKSDTAKSDAAKSDTKSAAKPADAPAKSTKKD